MCELFSGPPRRGPHGDQVSPAISAAAPVMAIGVDRLERASDRPRPGDVIASRRSARNDIYAISVIPGAPRAMAGAYDQALDVVHRLAELHAVDGWYTCNHIHFLRIAHHRSREAA